MKALLARPWVKPLLFVLCTLPAFWLVGAGLLDRLGANPAEALIRGLGDWTLRFLCLVLLVSPLRQHTGLAVLARWRRMLGLFVFFYASLHLLAYAWLDMEFDLAALLPDIVKRPFITVGMLGWTLLLALAATSFNRAIKALGARRWQRLHRAVYGVAGLGVLHFFWMRAAKNNFGEVAVYALILGALLAWRVWHRGPWRRGAMPAA
ncbi:sulfite oxidase heme-binding subunit YedZ [Hydrogenophaga sp. OTU3427]|uniref:sulfite oxidase heme-binding subunit YedZ n=1 Tax=Hydrogenophaga sp. OTU3427 TaxID=3043856 RepID=UPI00313A7A59